MKIEKIVKLKSGKYKLYLDNKEVITTFDEVILNNNLLFNKEIDNDMYLKINEENNYYNLLNLSIKYISKRLRSEKEIINYLENKTNDIYMINNIIEDLKNQNLINDRRFAKAYITDKINLTNSGIIKIKNELINLGVNEEIVEEEISNIDIKMDNSKLDKLILKKIRLNHKYSNSFLKQKILNDMLNLGYKKEDIINIFDKYVSDDKEIFNKEYNKIYNKLKNKYKDSELEYHIKQKMLQKGFKY